MHFNVLQQTRFYRCQLGTGTEIFTVKLSSKIDNVVCMHSIEFLRQENMNISQLCSKPASRRSLHPEAEHINSIIQQDFDKEIIILNSYGSLNIYKGDLPLIALMSDNEIPILLNGIVSPDVRISSISNPKKSRITLHFNNREHYRFDFQYKGKLRDFCLQSCLNVMQQILPLQAFYRFYEHFLYILFIPKLKPDQQEASAWKIFTELFFSVLDRKFTKSRSTSNFGKKLSAFEQMMSSRTSKQLMKGLKHTVTKPQEKIEGFDNSQLHLDILSNHISKSDLNEFSFSAESLFEVLHLMHEDMKLNIFKNNYVKEGVLAEFLFRFCLKLGPIKFGYSEFYAREYPYLVKKYEKDLIEYKKDYRVQVNEAKQQLIEKDISTNFKIPLILSKNLATVPSIYAWIESKLDPNQSKYEDDYY
jgi:hypothetical protein